MGEQNSKHDTSDQIQKKQQKPPYEGLPCIYHFLRTEISISVQLSSDTPLDTSSLDEYVQRFQQMYNERFRLLTFQVTPGLGLPFDLSVTSTPIFKTQAIFKKNEPMESNEHYSLQFVKSSIESGTYLIANQGCFHITSQRQTQTRTQHLYQMIHSRACEGYRLRCIAYTRSYDIPDSHMNNFQTIESESGIAETQKTTPYEGKVHGVVLFFEIPEHQNPILYQYEHVPVKLNVTCRGISFPKWSLQLDWESVMNQYLGSGWRLVEVFDDKSSDFNADYSFKQTTQQTSHNIVFIFEKPQSGMDDNTYEGTMIEFEAIRSISGCKSDVIIDSNWDSVIEEMGSWMGACNNITNPSYDHERVHILKNNHCCVVVFSKA